MRLPVRVDALSPNWTRVRGAGDAMRLLRRPARAQQGPVVREVRCKTVLNRSSISDYSLNCYLGCEHGCVYCYARFMQRFHPHPEPWGEFVDVKENAVEVLSRQLKRARPGQVFMSSACDAWQPMEQERELSRECCRLLVDKGFHLNILTKSSLVLRDLDVFDRGTVRVGVTIVTLDEELVRLWEPRASSIGERMRIIAQARAAGSETAVMFGPLLPFLSDSQASIDSLFALASDHAVSEISVDALNPRPRVWPSVAGLLRREYPDMRERYRRLLFDRAARALYLRELSERVERSAARHRLGDRVHVCF